MASNNSILVNSLKTKLNPNDNLVCIFTFGFNCCVGYCSDDVYFYI